MERNNIFIAVGQALFAVLGACVKWLNAASKGPQTMFSLLSEAVSAAFSGLLVYLMYEYFGLSVYVGFAVAGIIGHSGAVGIDHLGRIIIHHTLLKGIDYKPELLDDRKKE